MAAQRGNKLGQARPDEAVLMPGIRRSGRDAEAIDRESSVEASAIGNCTAKCQTAGKRPES